MVRRSFSVTHPFRKLSDVWASVPVEPGELERKRLREQIRQQLKAQGAVLVAHYYVNPDLQEIAEETGGFVGDSLEMARFGRSHPARTVAVAGVRFMGETAKILSPDKRIIMPDLAAECSLDLGCPVDEFSAFCDRYPDRVVVVYANTSAAVKARADWVITSSMAVELIESLHRTNKKIIWGPDRHLGRYLARLTGADMVLWEGACLVHDEFKGHELALMKLEYPDAIVLAHPESPEAVLALADRVGSTSQILRYARESDRERFIIATDFGIRHQLQKQNPDKMFIVAPTAGEAASCKSCAFCPWMALNDLKGLLAALMDDRGHEIAVDESLIEPAKKSLMRMVEFAEKKPAAIPASNFGPA